jgi:hypothetical protein
VIAAALGAEVWWQASRRRQDQQAGGRARDVVARFGRRLVARRRRQRCRLWVAQWDQLRSSLRLRICTALRVLRKRAAARKLRHFLRHALAMNGLVATAAAQRRPGKGGPADRANWPGEPASGPLLGGAGSLSRGQGRVRPALGERSANRRSSVQDSRAHDPALALLPPAERWGAVLHRWRLMHGAGVLSQMKDLRRRCLRVQGAVRGWRACGTARLTALGRVWERVVAKLLLELQVRVVALPATHTNGTGCRCESKLESLPPAPPAPTHRPPHGAAPVLR